MSPTQRSFLAIALCGAFAALPQATVPPNDTQARDVARIRHHLAGAEALLLARDASTLTPSQRAARARHVVALRAYRQRGVFPHNHLVADRRTPVFVDEHGTRCAMAYLIERSGDRALVARIASTRNLARIRELAGDSELGAWLDRNGLSVAEAARIQPEYPQYPPVPLDEGTVGSPEVRVATNVGAGAAVAGVGLNLAIASSQNARSTRGMLGLALGLLGAGLGATGFSEEGSLQTLAAIDVGLGLASMGLGIRQLNAAGGPRRLTAAPAITPATWRDEAGTRRVALTMRF